MALKARAIEMSWLSAKAAKLTDALVCLGRKIWRPMMGVSAALTVFVNGVAIPLWNRETISIADLALMLTACAPIMAARGIEVFKTKKLEAE